ncbi:MAG: hypothetical protein HY906_01970 [Deltaproteobacteria bacterium]|nr:hypothetical protein [Deltaproteobacteria bacterium]
MDSNQIQQVLLNLILNARDALNGEGEISIHSDETADGSLLEVEVADRGCGIAAEDLPRIFDPFFSTKGDQGNGLGLAAVQTIVTANQGKTTVESRVGVIATPW